MVGKRNHRILKRIIVDWIDCYNHWAQGLRKDPEISKLRKGIHSTNQDCIRLEFSNIQKKPFKLLTR